MRSCSLVWLLLLPLLWQPVKAQSHMPANLDTALTYLGSLEVGHNRGKAVEKFLHYVGLPAGNPWCASFVSYDNGVSGTTRPGIRTGLATRFITPRSIPARWVREGRSTISPGTIVIWRHGDSHFGHAALVVSWHRGCGITIEGNTVEGDYPAARQGVWIRHRCINPGNHFRIVAFTKVAFQKGKVQ